MTRGSLVSVRLPVAAVIMVVVSAGVLGMACQRATVCPKGWQEQRAGAEGVWCRQGARAQYYQLHPENRRPRQLCEFAAGQPDGPFKSWHPGGQRWIEGRYQGGQLQGRWQQWDEQGGKVAEAEYRDGRIVSGAPVAVAAVCASLKP